ncbi:MAG: hypothetical protein H6713_40140 [Myxococcales bacterium]|nr:hypothetical protein [Myxococcales bacterium]
MRSSGALATAALIFGVAAPLALVISASEAPRDDIMALGALAFGLLVSAGLGLIGLLLAIIALTRGGPGRARAIVGLVLASLPVLLAAALFGTRQPAPEELPLKPPSVQPPAPELPVG